MQYKAHIPAGIAFAATATLLTGQPLDFLMLAGGAIGGALPDIDVSGEDNQGSAVQHLGTKANMAMSKTVVLSPMAKVMSPVTAVLDAVVLGPACRIWRFLATRLLGPAYEGLAGSGVGRAMRLDRDDPSVHRGGLTHSLLSLVIFSIPIYPLCMLLHVPQLWAGIMIGMISHLVCDAFCKSGVKFLWPWVPNIGFRNEDGVGGREGIKLLPARALMKTGKCPTRSELRSHAGRPDYDEFKKYYLLEAGWQRFFQLAAIAIPVMVVTGIGPASGKVALAGTMFDFANKDEAAAVQQVGDSVTPVADGDPSVTTATDAAKFAEGRGTRVDEHKGPTSLTYGDIDATTLPAGIVKMPDESLWVPGVGPVTAETLSDPSLMLTEDEKSRILAAANWQRIGNGEVAEGVSGAVSDLQQGANDFLGGVTGQQQGGGATAPGAQPTANANGGQETQGGDQQGGDTSQSGSGFSLGDLFGGGSGNGIFGFNGLTPFTPVSD